MKYKKQGVKGFTLLQMLIVVAIAGLLLAIALPNLRRVRMNANMQLIQQSLKDMFHSMNEIYNITGVYPPGMPPAGASDPEQEVTASLFAIGQRGYQTNRYNTFASGTDYEYRTCPTPAEYQTAGDECYLLDPEGTRADGYP